MLDVGPAPSVRRKNTDVAVAASGTTRTAASAWSAKGSRTRDLRPPGVHRLGTRPYPLMPVAPDMRDGRRRYVSCAQQRGSRRLC